MFSDLKVVSCVSRLIVLPWISVGRQSLARGIELVTSFAEPVLAVPGRGRIKNQTGVILYRTKCGYCSSTGPH